MFLLNSRLGLFSATPLKGAPLFPKLRGHFAEFLNKGYPAHLRILSSPTCVGLRYGCLSSFLAAFLASVNSVASILVFCPHHASALKRETYFTISPALTLVRALPSTRSTYPPVSLLQFNV
jgi:hypothetical protein